MAKYKYDNEFNLNGTTTKTVLSTYSQAHLATSLPLMVFPLTLTHLHLDPLHLHDTEVPSLPSLSMKNVPAGHVLGDFRRFKAILSNLDRFLVILIDFEQFQAISSNLK